MSAAAATNRVTEPAHSGLQHGGIAVNASIPVAGMEPWRSEAIQKVIRLGGLPQNWDGYGSRAPALGVRQTAIDLVLSVPSEVTSPPAIVPVSGGGYHFEWTTGNKEVEISIDPECHVEALRVQNGMPVDDETGHDLPALFSWLASQ